MGSGVYFKEAAQALFSGRDYMVYRFIDTESGYAILADALIKN